MLSVNGLSVRYGKHLALSDVSFDVGERECVVILGANGAGKSSLLRAIMSTVAAEAGSTVSFGQHVITNMPCHEIVELGIACVPEGRGVFPELTVGDNLLLGANPKRARDGEADRLQSVYELFPKLKERRHQTVATMSGGEQQMVAIARAIMSNPQLLLLDEPSLGLAPIIAKELFATLEKIYKMGLSVLVVEQNVRLSLSIASRGYLLEAGRITGTDTAHNLMNDKAVQEAFLGH